MKLIEFKNKITLSVQSLSSNSFPRAHIAISGVLLVCLLIISLSPSPSTPKNVETLTETTVAPQNYEITKTDFERQLDFDAILELTLPVTKSVADGATVVEETVRSGDTLSKLFRRAGLSDRAMYELVNGAKEAESLAKIRPGHKLSFSINDKGQLQALTHTIDRLRSQEFVATTEGFSHKSIQREPEVRLAVITNTITSSLYKAGIDAGLDDQLIMELAGIFGWDVDFALDIRSGDSFKILFEEKYLDGKAIGVGNILAAEFINQGSSFKAVRYVDSYGKPQYYTPSGKAMQKAFLRAPLDFRCISSNFNPARLHPITGLIRPHRGTDYAASIGTPIWASGDGKVLTSAFSPTNGNFVVIQHGGDIQTKYLHLQKRLVQTGQHVSQKQLIGTVGVTGLSNGPHLHYEFLVEGVHRDPRTILEKLPKALSIDKSELQRFYAQTQPILAELGQPTRLASTSSSSSRL